MSITELEKTVKYLERAAAAKFTLQEGAEKFFQNAVATLTKWSEEAG